MLCKKCNKESKSQEIKGTLGMKTIVCCGEVQVDIDSLRLKVRDYIIKEEILWIDLTKVLDNAVQHQSTLEAKNNKEQ